MKLGFQVQTKIQKPLEEVFNYIHDPEKLSGYFTTGGASAPLHKERPFSGLLPTTPATRKRRFRSASKR